MRPLIALVVAALLALAPVAAHAQAAPSLIPPALSGPTVLGLPPGQAVTVGVGIVAGVVGLQALAGGAASVIAGAVAGALIGNWWYATYGATLGPLSGAAGPRT